MLCLIEYDDPLVPSLTITPSNRQDLSIQIDLAVDTMFWENLEMYRPWFYHNDRELVERKQYIVDYIVRMVSQVDKDVEVGIHNCYGKKPRALCCKILSRFLTTQ